MASDRIRPAVQARTESDERMVSRPVLGTVNDLADIFRATTVDEVAICLPAGSRQSAGSDRFDRRRSGQDRQSAERSQ